ncbi:hypothetical protein WA158_003595 [Blastocystis sp. Blastoise]
MSATRVLGKLVRGKTVFFGCDFQQCFRKSVYHYDQAIEAASFLLKSARVLNVPVLMSEQYPEKLTHTVPELMEIINAEGQQPMPVFPKVQFSMLTPEFEAKMKELCPEVTDVVVFGVEAHVCVMQTCHSLLEKGYTVHLAVDATSSRADADRRLALQSLSQSGVFLTTSESVAFQLLGTKEDACFKPISALVKAKALPTDLTF